MKNSNTKFKRAKKAVFSVITAISTVMLLTTTAFATGTVDASGFVSKAESVLKTLVVLIGAGLSLWGVINLLEAYGSDNAAGKSQGIKQLMAGGGIVIIGMRLVPMLANLF